MRTAGEIDALISERALIIGSPPPQGRDLDLLVRPVAERSLRAWLHTEGWLQRGTSFVRFQGCSAEAIDLLPVTSWDLPENEIAALFTDATPLEAFTNLVTPSPPHTLLIASRRLARRKGRLDESSRGRVAAAVDADATAWEHAQVRARSWGAEGALSQLRVAFETGPEASSSDRSAWLRAVKGLLRRRRGAIVTFSGLDGSGKTTQVSALVNSLHTVGIEAAAVWTKVGIGRALDILSLPVRHISREKGPAGPGSALEDNGVGKALRRRSSALNHTWATVVALVNVLHHRRAIRPHLRQGRVVVCDRYVLDTAAHLGFRYGRGSPLKVQSVLNKILSPTPLRSYFLDVEPGEALQRKSEQYGLEELATLAALYRREAGPMGVRRLDAATPLSELCELIASDVYQALR